MPADDSTTNTNARLSPRWDSLAADDRLLFAQLADDALARRDAQFLKARRGLWIDWLVTGSVGLFGLFVLGWSTATAALLVIVTYWFGWFADLTLWSLRSRQLAIGGQRAGDDMRFWQIVSILRGKRRQPPDVRGHPAFGLSLSVDLVAGGVASVLMVEGLRSAGVDVVGILTSSAALLSAIGIVLLGMAPALRTRFTVAADGSVAMPVFSAGQRGIGLLVLVFGLMAAGGGALSSGWLIGCANGFFVAMASIELTWGLPALRREIAWVREARAH